MQITVTKEETKELIVDYDSEQGNAIVKDGYVISVVPNRWHKSKDELPEHLELCWACDNIGSVWYGYRYDRNRKKWEWQDEAGADYWSDCSDYEVVYWMPFEFPEPPKEAEAS